MKLAKPFFIPQPASDIPGTATETDQLLPASSADHAEGSAIQEPPIPPKIKHRRPAILDLYTIRLSLIFESLIFCIMATGVPAEGFVVFSILLTFASGSSPATNSLALTLVGDSRQSGRLFGGVAVIQALGQSLIGPLMFGGLFSATVGTFAEGIFVLAAVMQASAFVLFMCVRLPGDKVGDEGKGAERGRSQRVKNVRSSSTGAAGVNGERRGKSAARAGGDDREAE